MGFADCLRILVFPAAALVGAQGMALDMPPPDVQRALEFGAAGHVAAMAFDGNPVEGMVFVREGAYRVWSASCSAEVAIVYGFDEAEPLSPPEMTANLRDVDCGNGRP